MPGAEPGEPRWEGGQVHWLLLLQQTAGQPLGRCVPSVGAAAGREVGREEKQKMG